MGMLQGEPMPESVTSHPAEPAAAETSAAIDTVQETYCKPAAADERSSTPAPDSGTDELHAMAASMGIAQERLNAYADWHWGVGWRRNAQGRARVHAEIESFRSDPQSLIDKITAEIGA